MNDIDMITDLQAIGKVWHVQKIDFMSYAWSMKVHSTYIKIIIVSIDLCFSTLKAFKMFCVQSRFAMENENSILSWIYNKIENGTRVKKCQNQ